MPLEPGTKLGAYEVVAPIGVGGMGEVYRARDTKLGRDVAIKILPSEVAEDADRLGRFRREAQVLASLNHPRIAAIYGLEEVEGRPFLVLELVEGEDLSARLLRGAISIEEALEIARQIVEGLEEAHAKGIVHRDLKPANVRRTTDGDIKILDFGLAKAYAAETADGSVSDLSQSPTLAKTGTQDGVILGTAAYMSPEQARGKSLDKRTDIWAFGAVLYEMLTGQKLFSGETLSDTLAAILKTEPDWRTLPAGVPLPVRRLLRRCLEKNPKARLHDIADARLELADACAGSSENAVQPTEASRLPWSLATLFFLTTVALGFLYLGRGASPGRMMSAEILPPPDTTFSLDPVYPGVPTLSPDGTMLAFTAVEPNGRRRLYVRSMVEPITRALPGTENAAYPFWSPDSRAIGFFGDRALKKVMASGGAPEFLGEAQNGKGGSWNREGEIVFAPGSNTPLHRVSSDGGEATPITELDLTSEHNSHRHPRFLPDGRHYLYLARVNNTGASEDHEVRLASLDGSDTRFLLKSRANAVYASGYLVFMRESALMVQRFDPDSQKLSGEAFPLTDSVAHIGGASKGVFSLSNIGTLIYQPAEEMGGGELIWADRQGRETGRLGAPGPFDSGMALSPDGTLAAVGVTDEQNGNSDLWIYDTESGTRDRFTFDAADDGAPVWSPDGGQIVFSSIREGVYDLYIKSVSGSGSEQLLLASEQDKTPLDWSKDGSTLIYSQDGDILALSMTGEGEPREILTDAGFRLSASLSPDGRWLAYEQIGVGNSMVFVTSFPETGRRWQVSSGFGTGGDWSADGKQIVYVTTAGQIMAVNMITDGGGLRVGTEKLLFTRHDALGGTASADQQKFLFLVRPKGRQVVPLILVQNWLQEVAP